MKTRTLFLLVNGILVIGSIVLAILSFSSHVAADKQSFYQNLFAELIGALITVNIIDRLLEARWNPVKNKLAYDIQVLLMQMTNEYLGFFGYNDITAKSQFDKIRIDDKTNPYVKTIYNELLKLNFEQNIIKLNMVNMMDLNTKIQKQINELDQIYNKSVSKIDVEEMNYLLSMNHSLKEAQRNLNTLLNTYMVSTTNQSVDNTIQINLYLGLIGINLKDLFGFMVTLEKVIEPKRRKTEMENISRALDQLKEHLNKK